MRAFLGQLLLCLLASPVVVGLDGEGKATEFMYANEHDVMEFFPDRPGRDFRESMKPKVVEFYNPFCGACKAYRPTYLKLASDILEEVGHEIEFWAISCQAHQNLCDMYEIEFMPTVALFRRGQQDPHLMKKLSAREKTPEEIIPYLLPDHGREIQRGLTEAGSESGEEEGGEKEDEEKEDGDDEREDEEENDNQNSNENQAENEDEEKGQDSEEEGPASEEGEEEKQNSDETEELVGGGGSGEEPPEDGDEDEENVEDEERDSENENGSEEDNEAERNDSEEGEAENNGSQEDQEDERDWSAEGEAENNVSEEDNTDESDEDNKRMEQALAIERDIEEARIDRDFEEANHAFFQAHGIRPGLGPADSPRVVKGAGAGMSREMEAEMDRFRDAWKKQHEREKSIFRRHEALGIHNKRVKEEHIDNTSGATKTMRAHTPGTDEYKIRQEKIERHHEALRRKQSLRTTAPQMRFSAGAGGAARFENMPANHKPVVSYKKRLTKERLTNKLIGGVPIIGKRLVVLSKEEELILDSSLSFMLALKGGLFSDMDPLNKHKKRALQGWLDLLRVSLPPEWGLHEVIMDLDNNLDYISQSFGNLQRFLDRHSLPRHEFSHSCTYSAGRSKAFGCGFWKLLHVVSVGVAEHRGGINLKEAHLVSKDARVFSPHEAAEAMKEFIGNFYPCEDCRNKFVAQYDDCSNRRCVRLTDETDYASFADWQEVSKWLWEVHNDVNVRLLRESHEKASNRKKKKEMTIHDEINALYPSLRACVACFHGDGRYDEDAVFVFLEKEYWPGASDIDPAADKLLYFHNTEYAGFASSWALLFLGVGIIYMCRPRGVFKGPKKRAD